MMSSSGAVESDLENTMKMETNDEIDEIVVGVVIIIIIIIMANNPSPSVRNRLLKTILLYTLYVYMYKLYIYNNARRDVGLS